MMDMGSMNSGMTNSTASAMMGTSFLTTVGVSNLWFDSWTPTTAAATFGASLGLMLLAIISRLLAAVKTSSEAAWSQSLALQRSAAQLSPSASITTLNVDSLSKDLPSSTSSTNVGGPPSYVPSLHHSRAPPFIPSIDIPRAVLFTVQAFVGYLLMLAVMTYNAWFFLAILTGLGMGEMMFGRWSSHSGGGGDGIHM